MKYENTFVCLAIVIHFKRDKGKGFIEISCKFITLYSRGNLHILYWFSPDVLKRKIKQFSDILQTFRSTRLVIWERRFKEVPKYKCQKGMKLQWDNFTLSISVGRGKAGFFLGGVGTSIPDIDAFNVEHLIFLRKKMTMVG